MAAAVELAPARGARAQDSVWQRSGDGDCYSAAFRTLEQLHARGHDGARLVHGLVTGTGGPMAGERFAHAWVEIGDVVIDNSNGQSTHTRYEPYYAIGDIDARELIRYSLEEARRALLEQLHYGPWHVSISS